MEKMRHYNTPFEKNIGNMVVNPFQITFATPFC